MSSQLRATLVFFLVILLHTGLRQTIRASSTTGRSGYNNWRARRIPYVREIYMLFSQASASETSPRRGWRADRAKECSERRYFSTETERWGYPESSTKGDKCCQTTRSRRQTRSGLRRATEKEEWNVFIRDEEATLVCRTPRQLGG